MPAPLLPTPLARVGDALRLGIEIPTSIRRWSDGLSRPELQGALATLIDETATWTFPEGESADRTDDPSLSFIVRRRDETESVRRAVRRICLPKQLDPYDLAAFAALETVLVTLDSNMGALLSRADVVRLLGTRAAMDPTWADGFPESREAGGEERATPSSELWPKAIRDSAPSDEVITRYATRGAMSRYVEGVADANDDFAGDLAACIDALLEIHEDVGLVARRWRKRAGVAAAADPLRFAAIPPVRLAAATTAAIELAKTDVRLGALSPLDATLRIVVTSQDVTVHVSAGDMPLERIEFGSAVSTSPTEDGYWQIVAPLPGGSVRLRVLATDGTEFAEELQFAPVDASDEAQ